LRLESQKGEGGKRPGLNVEERDVAERRGLGAGSCAVPH